DPFFAACAETGTVVCMHIGSSSKMPATSGDAPVAVAATLSFGNAMSSLTDFLFSGVLVRFPTLKLAYSEGQIGWIPYILERADDVWLEHRAWGGVRDTVPDPPSTYYYPQVFGRFFPDRHGLEPLESNAVGDGLPPPRLEVAAHEEGRPGAHGRSARPRRVQARARQRHPHARAGPLTATRHVALEGPANFRDVGGYAAAGGRAVRTGRLFRSGSLRSVRGPGT